MSYGPGSRLEVCGTKTTISLQSALGEGGEGAVFLTDRPTSVAKVYFRGVDQEKLEKLDTMVRFPPEDPSRSQLNHVSIAWPEAILCSGRTPVGYLMPSVAGSKPIGEVISHKSRRKQFPGFNYYYLHQTAWNAARIFLNVHQRQYVIGDVNQANLRVTERALVTLIDTDSFQIPCSQGSTSHRCPVGTPEYTPPELQGVSFSQVDRTVYHDRFGLAVLIFFILYGEYPYQGQWRGAGEALDLVERIVKSGFMFEPRSNIRPSPVTPDECLAEKGLVAATRG